MCSHSPFWVRIVQAVPRGPSPKTARWRRAIIRASHRPGQLPEYALFLREYGNDRRWQPVSRDPRGSASSSLDGSRGVLLVWDTLMSAYNTISDGPTDPTLRSSTAGWPTARVLAWSIRAVIHRRFSVRLNGVAFDEHSGVRPGIVSEGAGKPQARALARTVDGATTRPPPTPPPRSSRGGRGSNFTAMRSRGRELLEAHGSPSNGDIRAAMEGPGSGRDGALEGPPSKTRGAGPAGGRIQKLSHRSTGGHVRFAQRRQLRAFRRLAS